MVACGEETNTEDSTVHSKETVETSEISQTKMTAEDVLQKANQASADITNGQLTVATDMDITMDGEQQISQNTVVTQFQADPFLTKADSIFTGSGSEFKTTTYMDDTNIYMQMPNSTEWITQSLAELNMDTDQLFSSYSLSTDINSLSSLEDKVELNETQDTYTLTYSGSGDEVMEMVNNLMGQEEEVLGAEADDSNFTVNSFHYQVTFSKSTFLPVSFENTLDYESTSEDITIQGIQAQKGSFEKLGEISGLTLPDEIK